MGAPGEQLRGLERGPGALWVSHEGGLHNSSTPGTEGTKQGTRCQAHKGHKSVPHHSFVSYVPSAASYFTRRRLILHIFVVALLLLLVTLALLVGPSYSVHSRAPPLVQHRGPLVCRSGLESRDGHKSVWYLAARATAVGHFVGHCCCQPKARTSGSCALTSTRWALTSVSTPHFHKVGTHFRGGPVGHPGG